MARQAWYEGYLSTVINRDIRDFAAITRADALSTLLRVIAARAGTTRNYLSYLDMVYLTMSIRGWPTNLTSRLTKSPKVYPADSGVAAHLPGVDESALAEHAGVLSHLGTESASRGDNIHTMPLSVQWTAPTSLARVDRG